MMRTVLPYPSSACREVREGNAWLARLARGLVVVLLSALFSSTVLAQAVQPVPALTARVIDNSGTLNAQQIGELDSRLAAFERERGSQIVVLLVRTTAPEDIAAYAYRVADSWKIGRKDVGDGVLVVVAKDDRTVRIEVARTLEGAIPDLAAYRIIDALITPAFRQGDFAGGLMAGVDGLMRLIRGEGLPLPAARTTATEAVDLQDLGAFLFVAIPFAASFLTGLFGRKLGSALTGGATSSSSSCSPAVCCWGSARASLHCSSCWRSALAVAAADAVARAASTVVAGRSSGAGAAPAALVPAADSARVAAAVLAAVAHRGGGEWVSSRGCCGTCGLTPTMPRKPSAKPGSTAWSSASPPASASTMARSASASRQACRCVICGVTCCATNRSNR
ncbi:TPM domain-containing protein [Thauera humireducens]|uniref:TPM domain-containing protein n=1 Tax=Thauera humireducens TaxID=1134435 RepID=UPI003C73AA25